MAVRISKPAINLRSVIAKIMSLKPAPQRHTFWFSGNGAQVVFAPPTGWRTRDVFVAGAIQRPGAGEDYLVGQTGAVIFAVAPGAVDVAIMAEVDL